MTPKQLADAEKDLSLRAEHWAYRMPQLMAGSNRRPYWQFRPAGDMHDPPQCKALAGRIERFDSHFWHEHNPMNCKRMDCRCTIRAYAPADLFPDLKSALPRR